MEIIIPLQLLFSLSFQPPAWIVCIDSCFKTIKDVWRGGEKMGPEWCLFAFWLLYFEAEKGCIWCCIKLSSFWVLSSIHLDVKCFSGIAPPHFSSWERPRLNTSMVRAKDDKRAEELYFPAWLWDSAKLYLALWDHSTVKRLVECCNWFCSPTT